MDDKEFAHEEHAHWGKESKQEISDDERQRLHQLEVTLDQRWDLLHQRRARGDASLSPDDAQVRDVSTVEGYKG